MSMGKGGLYTPSVRNVNLHGRPVLTNVAWDDFVVVGAALRDRGAQVPGWEQAMGLGIWAWHFDWTVAQAEELHFSMQLPHGWVPGSTIYFHTHYALPAAGGGAGQEMVQWGLDYAIASIDGAYPAAAVNVTSTARDVQNEPIRQHLLDDIPAAGVAMAGHTESCVLLGRVYRPTNIGNDYQNDVILLSMDAHIEINSLGTHEIAPPFTK